METVRGREMGTESEIRGEGVVSGGKGEEDRG
jgi:hypothetical protein